MTSTAGGVGNFGAGRFLARDRGVSNPDPGLEPLPLGVSQGHRRNRQVEDGRRHPGNAIEGFGRRGVEQVQPVNCLQSLRLVQGMFTFIRVRSGGRHSSFLHCFICHAAYSQGGGAGLGTAER